VAKKKTVDKKPKKKDTIEGDASAPKYLTAEELHKFEIADQERKLLKLRIENLKLQSKLSESESERHKAELAFYNSRRELLLRDLSTQTEAHKSWTASLCAKYDMDSIDGYNPISGEIMDSPKPQTK
jgi:uncharacterized protein involved in exopolysaccharide biosynthesis